ncbi:MAG: Fe-S cluster assembly protein SufD [Ignavibacteriales bacterium]|nr:MAG: Fe-S cluster assembly protein SufD [Ignavibacteriales bacterium]
MSQITEFKDWFISNFAELEKSLNGEKEHFIHQLRKEAIDNFSKLNFPNTKDEEWKYTNISPLLNHKFISAKREAAEIKIDISKFLFSKDEHSIITFINGIYSKKNSKIKDLPCGVVVESLSSVEKSNPELVKKYFGKFATTNDNIFTALGTAFVNDGVFIHIPDNKVIEDIIHILYITDANDDSIVVQPRNLIIAGKNSQATIIEHYLSLSDSTYFTNSITEVIVDENAFIDHIKLQEESQNAFHISRMEVDLERSSNFTSHAISFGAQLSRNDINARFNDEGGECTLNGLFLTEDKQLCDTHTLIDHAKPHCNSHEHYKGILNDKSRGVFNGKVLVRKDAQKTNAFQQNNNIILTKDALVNTKPQLEIFADDVKCSHGATVGQLDADAMFYLKSRGIGDDAGKAILIHAFASDVVQSIKIEAIRNYLEEILTKKFNQ